MIQKEQKKKNLSFKLSNIFAIRNFSHVYFSNINSAIVFCWFNILVWVIQIIILLAGFILAQYFIPYAVYAKESIYYIQNNLAYGWLIFVFHSFGVSIYFLLLFSYIVKDIYLGSYKFFFGIGWYLLIGITIISIFTAGLGKLVFWKLFFSSNNEAITSFYNIITLGLERMPRDILGKASIFTVNKIYWLHILFAILIFIFWIVRSRISNEYTKHNQKKDIVSNKILFKNLDFSNNSFFWKILLSITIFLIIFMIFTFWGYKGNSFLSSLLANLSVTQIEEEYVSLNIPWYLSPFFTIIKYINNSFLSRFLLIASLFIWFLFPLLDRKVNSICKYRPFFKIILLSFILNIILMGYLAYEEITIFTIFIAKITISFYFVFFILLIPLINYYNYETIKTIKN